MKLNEKTSTQRERQTYGKTVRHADRQTDSLTDRQAKS